MAGINIDADLGVKGFLKGTDSMEKGLEDVADELEAVAKGGDDSLEKLSDKLKEAAKATKTISDASREVKKDVRNDMKDASEGVQNLKEEAVSTAKEAAASFDGSAESIIDAFQEVAANAFVGFGAYGVAAGLAAAAGIGIASAAFVNNEQAAQEAKDALNEFGLAALDSGKAAAEIDFVNTNIKKIITNADGAKKKMKDIEDLASKYPGLSKDVGLMAQAYAGNEDAIDLMTQKLQEELKAQDKLIDGTNEGAIAHSRTTEELEKEIFALQGIKGGLETVQKVEQGWLESGGEARANRKTEMDAINQAYDDAAGNVQDFVNKETGLFDTTKYIESMKRRETALADYQTALASSELSPEAKNFLNEQGAEAAATMLQGYSSGDAKTRTELNRIWSEAGKEGSGAAKEAIDKTFETPSEAQVSVKVDTATAEAELQKFLKNRKVQLQVELKDQFGRAVN